ncbi:site-specific integrase [Nocardia sp. NPDC049707]|uniref:tyrosine-type recombinase/integrase n=1 Tax=Nocardia sp. NPDC049707 TaxID=3154735 RepID=UPI00342C401B
MTGPSASPEDVAVALELLQRLRDLPPNVLSAPPARPPAPTFAEYIPIVYAAMPATSHRDHYQTYWNKILAQSGWAHRRLDEPTVTQLKNLIETIKQGRVIRRNARDGRDVARHVIDALRCLYNHAEADQLIGPTDNAAARLDKPRALPSNRHALHEDLLAEIFRVAGSTGNDPDLDILLLRLHIETACRRGGALGLRPCDLDPTQCLIYLREKGGTQRWQPVSPTLMSALCRHGIERGAEVNETLLRYRNGRPVGRRRYDYLWTRIGKELPWVASHGISTHWLRHTVLRWVERNFGQAVARAYAGHALPGSAGAIAIYTRAGLDEVAIALAELTSEPHPLARAIAAENPADARWHQVGPNQSREINS